MPQSLVKIGFAVIEAVENEVNLSCADLAGAILVGANLKNASRVFREKS